MEKLLRSYLQKLQRLAEITKTSTSYIQALNFATEFQLVHQDIASVKDLLKQETGEILAAIRSQSQPIVPKTPALAEPLSTSHTDTSPDTEAVSRLQPFDLIHLSEAHAHARLANPVDVAVFGYFPQEHATRADFDTSREAWQPVWSETLVKIITTIAPSANVMKIDMGNLTSASLADKLVGVTNSGARLLLLPFGFGEDPAINKLSRLISLLRSEGMLVICPAGNTSRSDLTYPARLQSVLSVAAVDDAGRVADFSTFGEWVSIGAPGVGIGISGKAVPGTSYSAATVVGVAALVLSEHPDYTADNVETVLRASASPLKQPTKPLGGGIVNALAALQYHQ